MSKFYQIKTIEMKTLEVSSQMIWNLKQQVRKMNTVSISMSKVMKRILYQLKSYSHMKTMFRLTKKVWWDQRIIMMIIHLIKVIYHIKQHPICILNSLYLIILNIMATWNNQIFIIMFKIMKLIQMNHKKILKIWHN